MDDEQATPMPDDNTSDDMDKKDEGTDDTAEGDTASDDQE